MEARTLVVGIMRTNSTRVERKVFQRVGGISLAARFMRKLRSIERPDVGIGILTRDQDIIDCANGSGVRAYHRSEGSISTPIADNLWSQSYEEIQRNYDRVIRVNPCMPFLEVKTIEDAIRYSRSLPFWTSVFQRNGWLWNEKRELTNGDDEPSSSSSGPLYYTMGSAFWAFSAESLSWDNIQRWQQCSERIMPYEWSPEFLDVDTPSDLELCRAWHNHAFHQAGRIKNEKDKKE